MNNINNMMEKESSSPSANIEPVAPPSESGSLPSTYQGWTSTGGGPHGYPSSSESASSPREALSTAPQTPTTTGGTTRQQTGGSSQGFAPSPVSEGDGEMDPEIETKGGGGKEDSAKGGGWGEFFGIFRSKDVDEIQAAQEEDPTVVAPERAVRRKERERAIEREALENMKGGKKQAHGGLLPPLVLPRGSPTGSSEPKLGYARPKMDEVTSVERYVIRLQRAMRGLKATPAPTPSATPAKDWEPGVSSGATKTERGLGRDSTNTAGMRRTSKARTGSGRNSVSFSGEAGRATPSSSSRNALFEEDRRPKVKRGDFIGAGLLPKPPATAAAKDMGPRESEVDSVLEKIKSMQLQKIREKVSPFIVGSQ